MRIYGKNNLSPADRLQRYTELHPNYDHSQTDMEASGKQLIQVRCLAHGTFQTTPKVHLQQVHTCPECCKTIIKLQPPTWRLYQKRQLTEMIPYTKGFDLTGVYISDFDKQNGSPKPGDFIARGTDHSYMWLVAAQYHKDNYQVIKDK